MVRKLYSFMVVTLDGFYEGPNGEFDWPVVDDEFNEFGIEQLHDTDLLLFGRKTYEGMASYWPTPAAREDDPAVAELMNTLPKIVVSTTLASADWSNTRLVNENVAGEIAKLKQEPGKGLAVMGAPASRSASSAWAWWTSCG
jgi:dihydrofolate reductase